MIVTLYPIIKSLGNPSYIEILKNLMSDNNNCN
jgi:hypothetical protein